MKAKAPLMFFGWSLAWLVELLVFVVLGPGGGREARGRPSPFVGESRGSVSVKQKDRESGAHQTVPQSMHVEVLIGRVPSDVTSLNFVICLNFDRVQGSTARQRNEPLSHHKSLPAIVKA